jgi:hypothetical protein
MQPIDTTIDLESFYSFGKLPLHKKSELLIQEGVALDADVTKDVFVTLYYMHGFFVEETFDKNTNTITDIIPFKKGFKLSKNQIDFLKNGLKAMSAEEGSFISRIRHN